MPALRGVTAQGVTLEQSSKWNFITTLAMLPLPMDLIETQMFRMASIIEIFTPMHIEWILSNIE